MPRDTASATGHHSVSRQPPSPQKQSRQSHPTAEQLQAGQYQHSQRHLQVSTPLRIYTIPELTNQTAPRQAHIEQHQSAIFPPGQGPPSMSQAVPYQPTKSQKTPTAYAQSQAGQYSPSQQQLVRVVGHTQHGPLPVVKSTHPHHVRAEELTHRAVVPAQYPQPSIKASPHRHHVREEHPRAVVATQYSQPNMELTITTTTVVKLNFENRR